MPATPTNADHPLAELRIGDRVVYTGPTTVRSTRGKPPRTMSPGTSGIVVADWTDEDDDEGRPCFLVTWDCTEGPFDRLVRPADPDRRFEVRR